MRCLPDLMLLCMLATRLTRLLIINYLYLNTRINNPRYKNLIIFSWNMSLIDRIKLFPCRGREFVTIFRSSMRQLLNMLLKFFYLLQYLQPNVNTLFPFLNIYKAWRFQYKTITWVISYENALLSYSKPLRKCYPFLFDVELISI